MTGMDTLTHIRGVLGVGRIPAEPWVAPWVGPTVWIVTQPDWEHVDILGVAATIEAAWAIVRAEPRCPDGAVFWEQDADSGIIIGGDEGSGRPYVIEPHELRGTAQMGA